MKNNPVTVYTLDNYIQVSKVVNGVAYDKHNQPIDEQLFGPNKHRILAFDAEYTVDDTPTISHQEMLQARQEALTRIKNNPERYRIYNQLQNHKLK